MKNVRIMEGKNRTKRRVEDNELYNLLNKKILYLTLMNQIISLLESLVKNIYRHATKARRVRLGERSRQ